MEYLTKEQIAEMANTNRSYPRTCKHDPLGDRYVELTADEYVNRIFRAVETLKEYNNRQDDLGVADSGYRAYLKNWFTDGSTADGFTGTVKDRLAAHYVPMSITTWWNG